MTRANSPLAGSNHGAGCYIVTVSIGRFRWLSSLHLIE